MSIENVKVVVRMRPHSDESKFVIKTDKTMVTKQANGNKAFSFDHIFDERTSQTAIHSQLCADYLLHTLEGYNTCMFAYGQTGSGKTFTMRGNEECPGIIPLLCQDLFDALALDSISKATVTVSYFEIYNEKLIDLLGDTQPRVRENTDKTIFIQDITEFEAKNVDEVIKYLKIGDSRRSVAATKMNIESSRSHAIFNIEILQEEQDGFKRKSNLKLVDLAGSERAEATLGQEDRMKEGSKINKSLSTLGRCILQLAKNQGSKNNGLIPYRESLLTWVLKENLGGNSKTCMIACVSPIDLDESISTLRYATTAKHIKLSAKMNVEEESSVGKEELHSLKNEMKILQDELKKQSEQLSDYHELNERVEYIRKLNEYLELQFRNETTKSRSLYENWKISKLELDMLYRQVLSVMGFLSISRKDDKLGREIDLLSKDLLQFTSELDEDIVSLKLE